MIAKIIEYSARNKFIVFLFVFCAIAWGYWALKLRGEKNSLLSCHRKDEQGCRFSPQNRLSPESRHARGSV